MDRNSKDQVEYSSAIVCIMAAIAIGVASIVVSETHDIAAGVLILSLSYYYLVPAFFI